MCSEDEVGSPRHRGSLACRTVSNSVNSITNSDVDEVMAFPPTLAIEVSRVIQPQEPQDAGTCWCGWACEQSSARRYLAPSELRAGVTGATSGLSGASVVMARA